jgi:hypothetical protein
MAKGNSLRVRVLEVKDTETVGASGFQKRELIGMIEGEYPEHFKFEFVQDKVKLLDDPIVLEGGYLTIHYNLRSRKVEKEGQDDMYFLSLNGWKIEV